MSSSRFGWAAAGVLAVIGCFHGASVGDAGATADASGCSTLASSHVLVQPSDTGTAAPPAAMGGTLVAGSYHLASTVYYPAALCTQTEVSTDLRMTLVSPTSGTIDTITISAAENVVSETTRFTASGTELTLSLVCILPDPSGLTRTAAVFPYTVGAAGELLLTTSDPGCGTSISTYVPDGT